MIYQLDSVTHALNNWDQMIRLCEFCSSNSNKTEHWYRFKVLEDNSILISLFLFRSGIYLMVHLWGLYAAIRRAFGVLGSRLWTSAWLLPRQTLLSRYGPCLIWHASRHLRVTLALSWRYVSWQKGCNLYQGEQVLFSHTVLPSILTHIVDKKKFAVKTRSPASCGLSEN